MAQAKNHLTTLPLSTLFTDARLQAVFRRWEIDNPPAPLPVEPSPYEPTLMGGAVAELVREDA